MKSTKVSATKQPAKGWLVVVVTMALVVPTFAQTSISTSGRRIKRTVLVSIPDRKLAVLENGTVVAYFSVAVGAAASPSPTGEFEIVSRVANPTYYHDGVVIPTGENSPIGTRWLGISEKSYGIHGTNAPKSIGHASSHGCIRLRNRDMERLFTMLHVGDVVEIRGERDEQIAQVFGGEEDGESVATTQLETLAQGGGQ